VEPYSRANERLIRDHHLEGDVHQLVTDNLCCLSAYTSTGCSAGDSVGPVLGVVVCDKGGLQATFVLQTAINALPLLLALLVLPAWSWTTSSSGVQDNNNTTATDDVKCAAADVRLPRTCSSDCCYIEILPCQLDIHVPAYVALIQTLPPEAAAAALALSNSNSMARGQIKSEEARSYHHMSSTYDLEAAEERRAVAAKQDADADHSSVSEHSNEQRTQQHRLDMGSVLSTVCDWVVGSQCLLVFLEQTVTSTVLVVIPVVMTTPTWLVGVVYIAMVSD
jgi:hypothetical protein